MKDKDPFKILKKNEPDYPQKMKDRQRRILITAIFINRWFWFIVFVIGMVILCTIIYGN
jgi:hypothetical protein